MQTDLTAACAPFVTEPFDLVLTTDVPLFPSFLLKKKAMGYGGLGLCVDTAEL